jgi:hypothetical protein
MVTSTALTVEGNEKIDYKLYSFIENIFDDILVRNQNETTQGATNHLLEKLYQLKSKFDSLRNDEANDLYSNVFKALDKDDKLDTHFIRSQHSNQKQEVEIMKLIADIEVEMSKLNVQMKHSILQLIFIFNVLFANPL